MDDDAINVDLVQRLSLRWGAGSKKASSFVKMRRTLSTSKVSDPPIYLLYDKVVAATATPFPTNKRWIHKFGLFHFCWDCLK